MFLALAEQSIQLVPDGTLFVHILLIVLMVFILNATLFRPINRILKEREEHTLGRSNETHAILKRIDASLREYEQSLRNARAHGYALLESYRAEALQQRQSLINSLREDLQASIAEEKRLIQKQVEQAQSVLAKDSLHIASEISSQVLHRPL